MLSEERLPKRKKRVRHDQASPSVVVVGGGIAGVCCAQEIAQLSYDYRVILVSASSTLKEAKSVMKVTDNLEEISVFERRADYFKIDNPRIEIIDGVVEYISLDDQEVVLSTGSTISYRKLCLCTGAVPSLFAENIPNIIGVRDLESVEGMVQRLRSARRVGVVGNGGIALELIHTLKFCDVAWVVKDNYIGNSFFDASASAFIASSMHAAYPNDDNTEVSVEPHSDVTAVVSPIGPYDDRVAEGKHIHGGAIGPEWVHKTGLVSTLLPPEVTSRQGALRVEYGQQVCAVHVKTPPSGMWVRVGNVEGDIPPALPAEHWNDSFSLHLLTTEGKLIGCDFVVSATGVTPCTSYLSSTPAISRDSVGGIIVNEHMQTSRKNVYAAGDCCSVQLNPDESDNHQHHWFQMRLWSQARVMGITAAQSMHCDYVKESLPEGAKDTAPEFWPTMFNIFAHITHFFEYKVVLLGRFNAQGLGEEVEKSVREMVITKDGLVDHKHRHQVSQGQNFPEAEEMTCYCSPADLVERHKIEIWTRITPGEEYIKLVVKHGKVIGALLIGDTDLEEVFENLILNELDVSRYGIGLLDPDIDVEEYFD